MTAESTWTEYRRTGSIESRNLLLEAYLPLVHAVAGRVRAGLPSSVEHGDLVSAGVFGLVDALARFEADRGLQFQTFAVPRIRGAMLDSLRASDWVPRSVRTRTKAVEGARSDLRCELNREPTAPELAQRLEVSVEVLRELSGPAAQCNPAGDDDLSAYLEVVPSVEHALEDEDTRQILLRAVRHLPQRDQVIIALYFFEGFTLAEIGRVLGVTESRVSQLRTRATRSLRDGLIDALGR